MVWAVVFARMKIGLGELDSLFTSENTKSNAAMMWEVLNPLPEHIQRRNEVPRKALIYVLSQTRKLHFEERVVHEIAQGGVQGRFTTKLRLPSLRNGLTIDIFYHLSLMVRYIFGEPPTFPN